MKTTFRSLLTRGLLPLLLIGSLLLGACQPAAPTPSPEELAAVQQALGSLIPRPLSASFDNGVFRLDADTRILAGAGNDEASAIGEYLAGLLRPSTGFPLKVEEAGGKNVKNSITLSTGADDPALGEEGYHLVITGDAVTVSANTPAGVFHGVQTLRQLLPPTVESRTVQPGPWILPTATITDRPRFAWRGMMLDVARHFFSVEEVERLIDEMTLYKLNRLHLHLADDQGWRIEIKSWPKLTEVGGLTEINGTPGGFYTQEDYKKLVAYAQSRYITIVPEIDTPGHTNAALASYAELNCDGKAREPFTGWAVGFSSLCIGKPLTFQFMDDVVGELAAMTPGPYIHIGGDEAQSTSETDYIYFVERMEAIVRAHGKQMVGWEEIAQANISSTSIAQHWSSDLAATAAAKGMMVIFSPADRAYIDMKYDESTPFGQDWAAYINTEQGYSWDPVTNVTGVPVDNILGVEAPLWSETFDDTRSMEYLTFPRLPGYAEMGWSPVKGRSWDEYRLRLAEHGLRWQVLQINFYHDPLVPWKQ
jgi:hexosaminidase